MALQIDKRLYEAQYYGGFEPGEPDDETFLLERLEKYPGDLPFEVVGVKSKNFEFSEEPEEVSQEVGSEKVREFGISSVEERAQSENLSPDVVQEEDFSLPSFTSDEEYEKEGKTEREVIPYEKAGIDKLEREARAYQKAGLIEDEEAVPYQRQGVEKEQIGFSERGKKEQKIKSIWDIFEEEPSKEVLSETAVDETTQEISLEANEETEAAIAQATSEVEPAFEPEAVGENESQGTETVLLESDSIVDVPLEIKVAKVDPDEFTKIFDEDFRNAILEDLAKSEQRRKEKEKTPEGIGLVSTREKEELQREIDMLEGTQSVEGETVEFDLSSIPSGKPSEMIAKDILEGGELEKKKKTKKKKERTKLEEAVEEMAQEPIEKGQVETLTEPVSQEEIPSSVVEVQTEQPTEPKTQQEGTEQEKEEKQSRKIPVLWLLSGALLLLMILLIGGYFAYINFIREPVPKGENVVSKAEESKEVKPKVPEIQEKKQAAEPFKPEFEPSELIEEPKSSTSKVFGGTEKVKPPKIVEITTSKEELIPEKKPVSKQERRFASKYEAISKTQRVKLAVESPISIGIEKPIEEYTIEIFSTPEIDEANYLLNQLQQKGINAYIKPFRFRNVNYYKIRIGPFRSIEEAKQVARSLGFRNFWIDRVK